MPALRILTLPIAMATFAILYITANKAPQAVEAGGLLIWPLLFIVITFRMISFTYRRIGK